VGSPQFVALTTLGVEHHLESVEGAPHSFHLQPKQKDLRPFFAALLVFPAHFLIAVEAPKPKPLFQYKSDGIEIPAATADEPKVKAFNADTIRAAAKYLDDGARAWVQEKSCVACHTTGVYLEERPAWTKLLGQPSEIVHAGFIKSIPDKLPEAKTSGDVIYYPGANQSVWRTAGLAEWDRHVTGQLSEATERSLRDMLMRQSSHGGYLVLGEVEIPHVTTDFELTLQAARAIIAAPGWLAGLKDEDLRQRVDRMKSFLRDAKPRNDYECALRLQLAALMPELVGPEERAAATAMLWQKQQPDGGWPMRRMSDVRNWRTPMSDRVIALIESQPDAAEPGSDPYMTGLAIVLLRGSGVPASDERIQRGLAWLKVEQRISGRWWMQSLYRGNWQYITYIATAQAMKALAMCGEIPTPGAPAGGLH
jgi:squalene-hopene/tetraprenyl-beta-curcumene cyclase